MTFSVTFHSLWSRIHYRSDTLSLHIAQTQAQNTFPSPYISCLKLRCFLTPSFSKSGKVPSGAALGPLNFWPVPWHATLCLREQTVTSHNAHTRHYVLTRNMRLTCQGDLLHQIAELHVLHFASATSHTTVQERFENVKHSEMFAESLQYNKLCRIFFHKLF